MFLIALGYICANNPMAMPKNALYLLALLTLFIGPRPERPEFVKDLSEQIPFYDVRHVIKPGLTGWAQVNHNYGTSKDDALIKLQ